MTCESQECGNDAVVALKTAVVAAARPTRSNIWTKIWWDESEAPKSASRYCSECAAGVLTSLGRVLA
jgi:hypothetical protein